MNEHPPPSLLAQYRLARIGAVRPLGGAGGFSGAEFWRLASDRGELCLRRWPAEHPGPEELARIHRFLLHAAGRRLPVPAPLAARSGETVVRHQGRWWELTPWMPGAADYCQRPSAARLRSALRTLAGLHLAGAELQPPVASGSKLVRRRLAMLADVPAVVARLQPRVAALWAELAPLGREVLARAPRAAAAALRQLEDSPRLVVPQQIVIRDIWHDHVLFQGEEVSGVVDFGAMSVDTVAADLARLLGSLCEDDGEAWQRGLDAYDELRRLSPAERELALTLDRAAVILSGLNWLRWLLLDDRRFPGREQDIVARMRHIARRLQRLG